MWIKWVALLKVVIDYDIFNKKEKQTLENIEKKVAVLLARMNKKAF